MAKKTKKKQVTKTSRWAFTDSQIAVLLQLRQKHQGEIDTVVDYQNRDRNAVLQRFSVELNVPQNIPVVADLDTLNFKLKEDDES